MEYYQVLISAETKDDAHVLLDVLLEKRLIFGGPIWDAPAKFWWKDEIIQMDYCFIFTYTREDKKDKLVEVAEKASSEEVCMISFTPFEGNEALIQLLDKTFE